MRIAAASGRRRAGFSYVEVLIATVLVTLALVPILEALEVGVRAGVVHEEELTRHYRARTRMEEVLARPFGELVAEEQAAAGGASVYSDAPGTPERRIVLLSTFDADDDGQPDENILHVRVEVEATTHALEALTAP